MKLSVGLRTLCVLGLLASAVYAADEAEKVTYNDHLEPVLRRNCMGCHNTGRASGGLDMSTYASLMTGGSSGAVIEPGDSGGSRLYRLAAHLDTPKMPPNGNKIDDGSLATIAKFIDLGALETMSSKAKISDKPKFDLALDSINTGKPSEPPMPGELSLEPLVRAARAGQVTALASNPWSPVVAVAGQHQVLLYNCETLDFLGVLPFEEGQIEHLSFSPNGMLLLASGGRGAESGKVVVWNIKTGERAITVGDEWDSPLAADINNQQTMIALGGTDKLVQMFATGSGEKFTEIKKHTDWVQAIDYSPDGVLLATADRSGGLQIWEGFSGREYLTLTGHKNAITDLAWRADSNVLASVDEDGKVMLWEMNNGNNIKTFDGGRGLQTVEFSRDGNIVCGGRDSTVRLFKGDGNKIRDLAGLSDLVMEVAFSHDGKRVIAGDWLGKIVVWDTESGEVKGELSANPPMLSERVTTAEGSVQAARGEVAKAKESATAAQAALDGIAKQIADAKAREAALGQEIAALEAETGKLKQAADQAEAERKSAEEKAASLEKQRADLAGKLDEAKKQAESDEAAKPKVEELATQLADIEAQKNAAAEQAKQLTAKRDDLKSKIAATEKNREDKTKAKAEAEKLAKDTEPKKAPAEAEVAKAKEALAAAEAELAKQEAQLARWRQAVATHQSKFGYEVTDAR